MSETEKRVINYLLDQVDCLSALHGTIQAFEEGESCLQDEITRVKKQRDTYKEFIISNKRRLFKVDDQDKFVTPQLIRKYLDATDND